jgi:hypothetical protein
MRIARILPRPLPKLVLVLAASLAALICFFGTLALVDHFSIGPDEPSSIAPKSVPLAEATPLAQLPRFFREQKFAENWDGEYLLQWEGIEGLNASESRSVRPIVKYHPALELVPAQSDGMHRLGIQARGLNPKVVYEVGVWVKASPDTKIGLNVFDAYYVTQGTSSFDLSDGKAFASVGAVRKSGVKVGPNHWHKAWVQMLSTNGWLVTYLQLLGPDGAPAYKGDGRKVVVFGGIEIKPTLEQLF